MHAGAEVEAGRFTEGDKFPEVTSGIGSCSERDREMKSSITTMALLVSAAHALGAATVRGKVVDERDRPLAGSTVWVHIRPGGSERPKPYSTWTRTSADGGFEIAGVPAGNFAACAQLPASPYVDGCFWEQPRIFTLTGREGFELGVLKLRQGHPLRVRIEDPRGELHAARQARKAADLKVGVWAANGAFYPLKRLYEEPNGEEYGAVVPYDAPLRMMVETRRGRLADERGAALGDPRAFRKTVTVKRGKEPPMIRLQVSGYG